MSCLLIKASGRLNRKSRSPAINTTQSPQKDPNMSQKLITFVIALYALAGPLVGCAEKEEPEKPQTIAANQDFPSINEEEEQEGSPKKDPSPSEDKKDGFAKLISEPSYNLSELEMEELGSVSALAQPGWTRDHKDAIERLLNGMCFSHRKPSREKAIRRVLEDYILYDAGEPHISFYVNWTVFNSQSSSPPHECRNSSWPIVPTGKDPKEHFKGLLNHPDPQFRRLAEYWLEKLEKQD